ncbi:MAG TPA: hypothetical protein VFN61_11675 [Acidimicrobiales bacterium]|nr:hypothetical protein [Acidimicrobiales bacterium]
MLEVRASWVYVREAAPELRLPRNGKKRTVLVPASLWEGLKARAADVEASLGPGGLLFPGPKGPEHPWTDGEFRRVFTAAARDAGVSA